MESLVWENLWHTDAAIFCYHLIQKIYHTMIIYNKPMSSESNREVHILRWIVKDTYVVRDWKIINFFRCTWRLFWWLFKYQFYFISFLCYGCNIIHDYYWSVVTKDFIVGDDRSSDRGGSVKHKNVTYVKSYSLWFFFHISSVLSPRLLKSEKTDNGHNVKDWFFLHVETSSFHIFERFNFSLTPWPLISSCPPPPRER